MVAVVFHVTTPVAALTDTKVAPLLIDVMGGTSLAPVRVALYDTACAEHNDAEPNRTNAPAVIKRCNQFFTTSNS